MHAIWFHLIPFLLFQALNQLFCSLYLLEKFLMFSWYQLEIQGKIFNCFYVKHFSCKIKYILNRFEFGWTRRYFKYKPTNGFSSFFLISLWTYLHQELLANLGNGQGKCFLETTSNNIGKFFPVISFSRFWILEHVPGPDGWF